MHTRMRLYLNNSRQRKTSTEPIPNSLSHEASTPECICVPIGSRPWKGMNSERGSDKSYGAISAPATVVTITPRLGPGNS